jgi:hypothetical protein
MAMTGDIKRISRMPNVGNLRAQDYSAGRAKGEMGCQGDE